MSEKMKYSAQSPTHLSSEHFRNRESEMESEDPKASVV